MELIIRLMISDNINMIGFNVPWTNINMVLDGGNIEGYLKLEK